MRYSTFINNLAIVNNKLNLTIVDAAIVEYMRDLCTSCSKKIEDKRIDGYTWFDYKNMLNELPLLDLKYQMFQKKNMKRIKESGLFNIKTIKSKEGSKTYIQQTVKCDLLDYVSGMK